MRYVIVDCGPIGLELARRWVEAGHEVVGTTPEPSELTAVAEVCTDAVCLTPDDASAIRQVVADADAAVLATRPPMRYTGSARERTATYRRSMLATVRAAVTGQRRLVLFSSVAVYGDGGTGEGPVTERTSLSTSLDPAPQSFGAVERMVLQSPHSTVLRLAELVVGLSDEPDPATAVEQLRSQFGEQLPFDPAALVHTIDYRDVAAAVRFVVDRELTGVFNLVADGSRPATVGDLLNGLAAAAGRGPFTFTGELTSPRRPVSSEKLRQAGFAFSYPG